MKSLCTGFMLIFCLLLSGCGGGRERAAFEEFSRELSEKEALSFLSELRCEYEDKSVDFGLKFYGSAEGCTISVLSPAPIAGLRANLKAGSSELQFEEAVLETGPLDAFGLSPMSALPKLMEALSRSYIESSHSEGDYRIYTLAADENTDVQVRFKAADMVPVSAEIISGGRVRVFCKIGNWQYD